MNQIEEVPAKMQHALDVPMPGLKQSPLNKDDILDGDRRPCCSLLFPSPCAALSSASGSAKRKPEHQAGAPATSSRMLEQ